MKKNVETKGLWLGLFDEQDREPVDPTYARAPVIQIYSQLDFPRPSEDWGYIKYGRFFDHRIGGNEHYTQIKFEKIKCVEASTKQIYVAPGDWSLSRNDRYPIMSLIDEALPWDY